MIILVEHFNLKTPKHKKQCDVWYFIKQNFDKKHKAAIRLAVF